MPLPVNGGWPGSGLDLWSAPISAIFRVARNGIGRCSGKNVKYSRRKFTPVPPIAPQHGVTASRKCGRPNQEGVITMGAISEQAANLRRQWTSDSRWTGIVRDYTAQDVIRLRGSVTADGGTARRGADRLWRLLHTQDTLRLPLLAADEAGTAARALAPVVADAEAGPGLDGFDQMTAMIAAGAAGVHFEDQQPSPDGRGGKALIPTGQHIRTLTAARLAADVLDVPALVIARTGAHAASWLTSDDDERDHEFLTGERTAD